MSTAISKISDNIERLQVYQDRRALHAEQRNQYVLEGVVQGMGKVNDKIDALVKSLAASLSDAAGRMTSITQEQEQGGLSITEGSVLPRLGLLSKEQEAPGAPILSLQLSRVEESSLVAPPPSIIHPRCHDDSGHSVKTQDKIQAVAVVIAHYRRERGEVDPPMPRHMPLCTLVPRPNTLEGVWQEWFYGVNGSPSVVTMDSWYSNLWRSEKNSANPDGKNGFAGLYLFKKTIVQSVLRYIPDNTPIDMAMIAQALQDFQDMLKEDCNSCSIAAYYKLLPKKVSKRFGSSEEKEQGKGKVKAKEQP
ncbi:hypothetical protein EMPS_09896 [Entomortierella parvispora]|nr:hypothetical protein EMPS_09896 [Entomortierella parvispora]